MSKPISQGYTLMELMITVAIIGILASIAIPAYNGYVLRANRAEGKVALMDAAAILERFYSDNNRYATQANTLPARVNRTSETGKYNISIEINSPFQAYILTAIPQFTDSDCGNLTLTQAGVKSSSAGNSSDCWSR